MLPREKHCLIDMLNAAKLAQDFVTDINWETFESDLMRQAAVTRQIEIIGEAAQRISTESRSAIPTIPWDQIIEMRNRLIYEYDRLNLVRIWDTVHLALPKLIAVIEKIMNNKVDALTEEEIDTSDIPPLTEEFFSKSKW